MTRRVTPAAVTAIGVCLTGSGCVSIQAIEPVMTPPPQYQTDVTVNVEFLNGLQIGLRCAERGAKFLGLPGINSGSCADEFLITMLDPCATVTAGAYAHSLCEARLVAQKEEVLSSSSDETPQRPTLAALPLYIKQDTPIASVIGIEFLDQPRIADVCHDRGLRLQGEGYAGFCVGEGKLTVANPCSEIATGWYERLFCHELAHANGWPANHATSAQRAMLPLARESPEARAFAAVTLRDASGENGR